MSRSSVSSLRRTRISPSFSPVLFWSASARSSCSCVTRRSETCRSPKRLPTGAWFWPRGATVMAPTLTSRPSSGRASGGLGCSCRRSVPIASRLDPQTRCQPRGSGRVEGKQEFSQWRRRATGGPSGQFRCRVASFFSARLLAVALPLTAQYRHLLVERSADGFVVTVTLNRPDAMNAMNTAMGEDLLACFDGLLRDSLVRAVVFTGAGKPPGRFNHLVPPGHARAKALEIAETIARNGPIAVRQAKKAIAYGLETDLDTAMILALEAYNATVVTEDRLEGVRAFNEKRNPQFKGR